MPVYLRPEEREALPQQVVEEAEEGEPLLSAADAWNIARPCLLWLIVACVPLIAGLTLLRGTLIAMEKLRLFGEDSRALTPLAFFVLYGGCFGAFLASRLSYGDVMIYAATAITALFLAAAGGIYALTMFPLHVPSTCWVALSILVASAMGGAFFHTKWSS